MAVEIEQFLAENSTEYFKAGEIARKLGMPKADAKRRLKKLAKRGRVEAKKGKYRALKVVSPNKAGSNGSNVASTESSMLAASRLEETARRVGISVDCLTEWVEEKKRRASEDETKKLMYDILHDLEKRKGNTAAPISGSNQNTY